MLRRIVIGFGVAIVAVGIWFMDRTHARVGVCGVIHGAGSAASTGANCVRIVMSYSEGFVFVAAGLVLIVIAVTMISRRQRLELRTELKAVPRRWATRDYSITSASDQSDLVGAQER